MLRNVCSPAIGELQRRKPVPDLFVHRSGDADAARCSELLEPCGNVDAIAEQIITGGDYVAHVNCDPQRKATIDIGALSRGRKRLLDPHRAADGLDNARERSQQAVTRGLEHAPAMLRNRRIDNRHAETLESGKRVFLVGPREAAEPGDIGDKDGGEAALHGVAQTEAKYITLRQSALFGLPQDGQQPRELGATDQLDRMLAGKGARVVGDLAGRDVDALVRVARLLHRMEAGKRARHPCAPPSSACS